VEIIAAEIAGTPADDYECGGPGVHLQALRPGAVVGELEACVRDDHLRLMGVDVEPEFRPARDRHRAGAGADQPLLGLRLSTASFTFEGGALFDALADQQIEILEETDPAFEDDEDDFVY
jgi:hypothetical protein